MGNCRKRQKLSLNKTTTKKGENKKSNIPNRKSGDNVLKMSIKIKENFLF